MTVFGGISPEEQVRQEVTLEIRILVCEVLEAPIIWRSDWPDDAIYQARVLHNSKWAAFNCDET